MLAARINGFEFATLPSSENYAGRWETSDKSAGLSIDVRGMGARFVLSRGSGLRYASSWNIAPIEILVFSKEEPTLGSLISLGMVDGEDVLALFGDNKIRLVEVPDGSKLHKVFDLQRVGGT